MFGIDISEDLKYWIRRVLQVYLPKAVWIWGAAPSPTGWGCVVVVMFISSHITREWCLQSNKQWFDRSDWCCGMLDWRTSGQYCRLFWGSSTFIDPIYFSPQFKKKMLYFTTLIWSLESLVNLERKDIWISKISTFQELKQSPKTLSLEIDVWAHRMIHKIGKTQIIKKKIWLFPNSYYTAILEFYLFRFETFDLRSLLNM